MFSGYVDNSKHVEIAWQCLDMATSSKGNIFRVTGPLWGESTGDWLITLTKASDVELWCFLWSAPEQTVEQTFEMPVIWDASHPVWCLCDGKIHQVLHYGAVVLCNHIWGSLCPVQVSRACMSNYISSNIAVCNYLSSFLYLYHLHVLIKCGSVITRSNFSKIFIRDTP